MNSAIIVVSGLPRSGTSLMMQMLDLGGVPVVTDNVRTADPDNPRGYYEFEPVKKIKEDASWLPATRGKAFKMVSQLLYDLPATEKYRIVFMERDLDETLVSQEKMLQRLGRQSAPRADVKRAYLLHLERLRAWLEQQSYLAVLRIGYRDLISQAEDKARQIEAFLGEPLAIARMVTAVDPSLYRNRVTARDSAAAAFVGSPTVPPA